MSETKPRRQSDRKKPAPVNVYECPSKRKWTVSEKRALLEGIKKYGPDDPELLHRSVPTRNCNEIEWFVKKIAISKNWTKKNKNDAPLDKWLQLVLELVQHEETDFSTLLSQVTAVIAHGEYAQGQESDGSGERETVQPNYSRMYQYMEALLSGKAPPLLSQVEAAIFLELMYGLADRLRTSELDMVKNLMLWKYDLLTEPVIPSERNKNKESIRSALDNDWSKGNHYGLPTREDSGVTKESNSSKGLGKSNVEIVIVGPPSSIVSEGENSHIVGHSGDADQLPKKVPVTKKVAQKRTHVETPSKKSKVAKWIAEANSGNKEKSVSSKSSSRPITGGMSHLKSVFPVESVSSTQTTHTVVSPSPSNPGHEVQSPRTTQTIDSKAVDTEKDSPVKVFKKPVLYTLNPLCIPVSLLSLQLGSKDNSD